MRKTPGQQKDRFRVVRRILIVWREESWFEATLVESRVGLQRE